MSGLRWTAGAPTCSPARSVPPASKTGCASPRAIRPSASPSSSSDDLGRHQPRGWCLFFVELTTRLLPDDLQVVLDRTNAVGVLGNRNRGLLLGQRSNVAGQRDDAVARVD